MRRFAVLLLLLTAAWVGTARDAAADDREKPAYYERRPYLQLRVGQGWYTNAESNPVLTLENPSGEPPGGFAAGLELSRNWCAEIAIDNVETPLWGPGNVDKFGEYSMWTFLAQARWRYPLLRDRLMPYALVGFGAGTGSFNDRNVTAPVGRIGGTDWSPLASVGVGLEYFVAHNIAIGVEARYLFLFDTEIEVEGTPQALDLDALFVQASLRVHFPPVAPPGAACRAYRCRPPRDTGRFRGYLGVRVGVTTFPWGNGDSEIGIEKRVVEAGASSVGVNITRHLGLEIATEYGETSIERRSSGSFGEYSLWTALAQVRLSYPLQRGRLVPYALLGGGMAWGEINDRTRPEAESGVSSGTDRFPVAAVGLGLEYFVADNLALDLEAKQIFPFRAAATVDGQPTEFRIDPLFITFGLRIFFP